MTLLESTFAFLFRRHAPVEKHEVERRKTCSILRNITDPAEAVAECLIEQPTKNDHDTAVHKRATPDR